MKCKFIKFSPLKGGGITITLESTKEHIQELVCFMQSEEVHITTDLEMDDKTAVLEGLRSAAQQIADAVCKELFAARFAGRIAPQDCADDTIMAPNSIDDAPMLADDIEYEISRT